MEETTAFYGYESMDDLKHKLLYTNLELQKMKMKANVRLREHKDHVQNLLNLLANAYRERDGARDQLHKLIYKFSRTPHQVQPDSPILSVPLSIANFSKSESNSEPYNHLSHCSSSADSFFDAVTSPDFVNKNVAGSSNMGLLNQPFVQEQQNRLVSSGSGVLNNVENDRGAAVIDYLSQRRVLPQKGKLLKAVMDAGPLLESLLMTAPLPQWRVPPHQKPTNILPDSTKGDMTTYVNQQNPGAKNPISAALWAPNSSSSNKMNHPPQFVSNSLGAPSGSGLSNACLFTSSASTNSQNSLHKRHRLM